MSAPSDEERAMHIYVNILDAAHYWTGVRRSVLFLLAAIIAFVKLEGVESLQQLSTANSVFIPLYVEAACALLLAALSFHQLWKRRCAACYALGFALTIGLLAYRIENGSGSYTLALLPFVMGGLLSVAFSIQEGRAYIDEHQIEAPAACTAEGASSGCNFEAWRGWAERLPMGQLQYHRIALTSLEAGVALTALLVGVKLDDANLSWGSVLTPVAVAEFSIFPLSLALCLINECIDPDQWTLFSSGFFTRAVYLLPPVGVFQFLLMAQLDHRSTTTEGDYVPWSVVFAPLLAAFVMYFLSETLCYGCCDMNEDTDRVLLEEEEEYVVSEEEEEAPLSPPPDQNCKDQSDEEERKEHEEHVSVEMVQLSLPDREAGVGASEDHDCEETNVHAKHGV